ncbi:MAG: methyltransferase domain-containing protein [Deltaproteobacteria bacterium]|nr:methyltransferase domain-containing protein [Deltaproteobacteria bacterium]MBW2673931.1 methyltransferase domain-containing protein [Deltaproteobacteria bacterium]
MDVNDYMELVTTRPRVCLNVGCGRDYRKSTDGETWVNVDHAEQVKADAHFDLEGDWSFASNDFDYALIKHVLEHISDLTHFMEELYRVMKPAGEVDVEVPHWAHHWSVSDPDHKRVITPDTFTFFNQALIASEAANPRSPMTPMDVSCDFRVVDVGYNLAPEAREWWSRLDKKGRAFAANHLIGVIDIVKIRLEVVKEGKLP